MFFSINSRIVLVAEEKYIPVLRLPLSQVFQAFFINRAVRPYSSPFSVYSFPYVDHGVGQKLFQLIRNRRQNIKNLDCANDG